MPKDGHLEHLQPGESVPGNPDVISMRGYDPMRHNLFGLDFLYQDKSWVDREGKVWALEEMEPRHRRNVLALLRRQPLRLAIADVTASLAGPFAARGDMAQLAQEEAIDDQLDHPAEWLEETKFVKRLVELVDADDRAEAERRESLAWLEL